MRWQEGRRSSNVEDRRGQKVRRAGAIGGGTALALGGIGLLLGGNPLYIFLWVAQTFLTDRPIDTRDPTAAENETAEMMTAVLAYTEDTWAEIFAASGRTYRPATMVLFTDVVNSACGFNTAATGPFYCPLDANVYLDVGFFEELARMGGSGDFAQAYVLAHEVGHHVQNLLGTSEAVQRAQRASRSQADVNALSVLLELQADCYAGVWAHHAARSRQLLEAGDVEEGLNAASAIGDDRLQRMSQGRVVPDAFTHGSSEQRVRWFRKGLETGSVEACDTFSARQL